MPDAEQMKELAEQKLVQYLYEAHAAETTQVHVLGAHIAMTPAGRYRSSLEAHLRETVKHAQRLERNLAARGEGTGVLHAGYGLAQGMAGQVLAITKFPMDLVRGMSGEEKLLKNAKEECATEALEVATYLAIEQLAAEVGDTKTQELAASIRADEEQMLERLLDEIPRLTTDVFSAEVEGSPRFNLLRTGAADAARTVATGAARTVSRSAARIGRRSEQATNVSTRPARPTASRSATATSARASGKPKSGPKASASKAKSKSGSAKGNSRTTKSRTTKGTGTRTTSRG